MTGTLLEELRKLNVWPLLVFIIETDFFFFIHVSVHRESNWITVQQDETVFSLSHIYRQLYMFRVLKPTIRSSYSCNYSFWHSLTVMSKISSIFYSLQLTSAGRCNYSSISSWWWMSPPETCRAVRIYVINWIQSHLVRQLFNRFFSLYSTNWGWRKSWNSAPNMIK